MTGQNPALYILMRSDMASLNAGKAMAQAAHAANQFVATASAEQADISAWTGEAGTFGTTLVLEARSEREMLEVIGAAREDGFISGVTHDHTYPVSDGRITHLIPVNTCGFIYTPCRKAMYPSMLAGFRLHP